VLGPVASVPREDYCKVVYRFTTITTKEVCHREIIPNKVVDFEINKGQD
jgi:hypothetical protein